MKNKKNEKKRANKKLQGQQVSVLTKLLLTSQVWNVRTIIKCTLVGKNSYLTKQFSFSFKHIFLMKCNNNTFVRYVEKQILANFRRIIVTAD